MIKAIFWIIVGVILANIYPSIIDYFTNSDAPELIIEYLEGLKSSEEI